MSDGIVPTQPLHVYSRWRLFVPELNLCIERGRSMLPQFNQCICVYVYYNWLDGRCVYQCMYLRSICHWNSRTHVTDAHLCNRDMGRHGQTVCLVGQPDYTWTIAWRLVKKSSRGIQTRMQPQLEMAAEIAADEDAERMLYILKHAWRCQELITRHSSIEIRDPCQAAIRSWIDYLQTVDIGSNLFLLILDVLEWHRADRKDFRVSDHVT